MEVESQLAELVAERRVAGPFHPLPRHRQLSAAAGGVCSGLSN